MTTLLQKIGKAVNNGLGYFRRRELTPEQLASLGTALTRLFRFNQGLGASYQQAQSLEAVRHYRGWAYVAVRAIAEKIGQYQPTIARRVKRAPNEKSKHTKAWRERTKSMTTLQDDEELVPLESDHPLVQLLHDPNAPDVSFTLWYRTIMYWELTGKFLWWLPHNDAGMPVEIWCLPTHWCRPDPGMIEGGPLIQGYWVRPMEGAGMTSYIRIEDLIEVTQPSPVSMVDGYGPLQGGSAWLDTHEAMDASQWHQMRNLHNPGLVLSLRDGVGIPTDSDLERAYAMLAARLGGEGKNRAPLILPPGWTSAGRFGMTNEELDFVNSDDRVRDKVLSLFRVPKGVIGIDPTSDTSAYAPNAIFFDQCINPKLCFMGQVLTEKLGRRFGDDIVIYWENAAPINQQLEHQKYNDALDRCTITVNEYREHMGKAPVDWGNIPMQRPGYLPMMSSDTTPLLSDDELRAMLIPQGAVTDDRRGKEDTAAPPAPAPVKSMRERIKAASIPAEAIKVTLPSVRQETSYSCGAAVASAICRAYAVGPDEESWYRDQLGTEPDEGTDQFKLRGLFDQLGLCTIERTQTGFDTLKQWLDQHCPVIMLIQAWGAMPEGYDNPRSDAGHYVIAIGYTADELIVEDPALQHSRGYLPWDELLERWHIPGLEQWALAVSKRESISYVRRINLAPEMQSS